jgi:hypothetical protein
MRAVFAIVAVSILSTSAHAKECYKLPWAERGACHLSDPTFPVRYDKCTRLIDERGFKGAASQNPGVGLFFNECMHRLATP